MTSTTELPYTIRKRRSPEGNYVVDLRATLTNRSRWIGHVGESVRGGWTAYPAGEPGSITINHPTRAAAAAAVYAKWLQR